jgi:leucyl aminopeptidase
MTLSFALRSGDPSATDAALLAILLPAGTSLPNPLQQLDRSMGGAIGRAFSRADFRGARDELLYLDGAGSRAQRVLLVGLGKPDDRTAATRRAASLAARQAVRLGTGELTLFSQRPNTQAVEALVVGASIGAWEYNDLKTPPPKEEQRAPLARVNVIVPDVKAARPALAAGEALAAGHAIARRLAQMPGNLCTPDLLADTAKDLAKRHNLTVTVLGRREMEREGMGSFLSVAQGTPQDPKLVTIEYSRGKKGAAPIVLVGKGLCFDTGGISIKPADRMEFMKFDMCGAAGVIGAMEAIARIGIKANVIGVFGATTNMPSGTAVKPGDVVISHLGKSIEVINTDAEGRLVLADLLSYVRRFKPDAVIDAATLTGACVVALGHIATGVFGSSDALVNEVLSAGKRASEPGWPLPMWSDYKELIKSDVADIKNTGGRPAGSITAALFLREFTEEYPWVHLDIAGTAYSENDLGFIPRGPTGVPVGTFVEFVRGRAR